MTVVMDCHRPSAFAMMKGANNSDFFLFSIFILAIGGLWIASLRSQ